MEPEQQQFAQLVSEAHTALRECETSSTSETWQRACIAATRLLTDKLFPLDQHFFCDSSWAPFARASLMILSIPSPLANYLYSKISDQLALCSKCVAVYHNQKTELVSLLQDDLGLTKDKVNDFTNDLIRRDATRVSEQLHKWRDEIQSISGGIIPDDTLYRISVCLFECLYSPKILSENTSTLLNFKTLLLTITLKRPDIFKEEESLLAGFVVLLFGEDHELHMWAKHRLVDLPGTPLSPNVTQSLNDIMDELQTTVDTRRVVLIFMNLYTLFRHFEPETLHELIAARTYPSLIHCIIHRVAYNATLFILQTGLKLTALLLEKLSTSGFLRYMGSLPPIDLAKGVLENPSFLKAAVVAVPVDATYDAELQVVPDDMFDWLRAFEKEEALIDSKEDYQLTFFLAASLHRALTQVNSEDLQSAKKTIILFHLFSLMKKGLMVKFNEAEIPLISQVDYLLRLDMLELASRSALLIVNNCKSAADIGTEGYTVGLDVISLCLRFDIARDLATLHNNKIDLTASNEPKSNNSYNGVWKALNQVNQRFFSPPTALVVLKALRYAVFLTQVDSKNTNEPPLPSLTNTIESIRIISEMNENVLRLMLKLNDPGAISSLFLLSFSANEAMAQPAIDTLTQAFDPLAANRAECYRKMLKSSPKVTLACISDSIRLVAEIKVFSPSVGVLKIAQDMLESLYEPRTGVMNEKLAMLLSKEDNNELLRYWNANWYFLKFTIQNTKLWSKSYPTSVMLDFVRDELDYCHDLLEKFRFFEADLDSTSKESGSDDGVSGMGPRTTKGDVLSGPVIDSVGLLCGLLRLRDAKLIDTSCSNIKMIFSLMKSFQVPIPTTLVNLFIDYASRMVKNNMSEEMTRELLVLTGKLTMERIEEIIQQGRIRKEGGQVPSGLGSSKPGSNFSSHGPSATLKDFLTPVHSPGGSKLTGGSVSRPTVSGQKTLLDYGHKVPGRAPLPPPPPPEPAARLSQMDLVRQRLAEARKGVTTAVPNATLLGKPVVRDIHPPRAAGFNSKDKASPSLSISTNSRTKNKRIESDSDSDDSDDDGLFAVSGKKRKLRTGEIQAGETGSRRDLSAAIAPQVNQKEIDEKNMRARMNVDLNPLYKQILAWDYFHPGEYPIKPELVAKAYRPVPEVFKSVEEYQNVFEPLLLLECWQQLVQTREGHYSGPFRLDMGKRVRCDDFYDVYASVARDVLGKEKLTDSDIILINCNKQGANTSAVNMGNASQANPYCLAKITKITTSKTTGEYADVTFRVFQPPAEVLPHLAQGNMVNAMKVMNLITIEREYSSLKGLPYYELKDAILKAEPAPLTSQVDMHNLQQIMRTNNVNEAQAKSIIYSAGTRGFSLILGPPGTGKTKTILGVVGMYLGQKTATRSDFHKRILLCAPSNAAVDELVLRLKSGVYNQNGAKYIPDVVRLGKSDAVNSAVRDVTLEEIVDRELEKQNTKSSNHPERVREEQAATTAKLNGLRKKRETQGSRLSEDEVVQLDSEIRECIKQVKELRHQEDVRREEMMKENRKREFSRRQIQDKVLERAQVVCSTLSGASHGVLSSLQLLFDTVIVDEAAQSIELSSLIPLKYGCRQCILVGDPNQLPPTVLSQAATSLEYEKSLFVRMFNKNKSRVHMLDTQFRMHPDIAEFPSKEFYEGKVVTGPMVRQMTKRPWHNHVEFASYRFFNVVGRETVGELRSFYNEKEAQVILELYMNVTRLYPKLADKTGIISPYKRQVQKIKELFCREYGNRILDQVDFNSVDGFQGQEKELIIVSCVRADEEKGVGFLKDRRRLNVAITRAQCSLWIVGHADHLARSPIWKRLIDDAKGRKMFAPAQSGFLKTRGNILVGHESDASNVGSAPEEKRLEDISGENGAQIRTAEETKRLKSARKKERKRKRKLEEANGGNPGITKLASGVSYPAENIPGEHVASNISSIASKNKVEYIPSGAVVTSGAVMTSVAQGKVPKQPEQPQLSNNFVLDESKKESKDIENYREKSDEPLSTQNSGSLSSSVVPSQKLDQIRPPSSALGAATNEHKYHDQSRHSAPPHKKVKRDKSAPLFNPRFMKR